MPLPVAARAEQIADTPADPVARGLMDIKLADRSFETDHFIAGARSAYEMIVTAFARGDRAQLRRCSSDEVYAAFDQVIAGREQRKEAVSFTFVGFKDVKIVHAALKGRIGGNHPGLRRAVHFRDHGCERRRHRRRFQDGARRDRCVDLRARRARARSQLAR